MSCLLRMHGYAALCVGMHSRSAGMQLTPGSGAVLSGIRAVRGLTSCLFAEVVNEIVFHSDAACTTSIEAWARGPRCTRALYPRCAQGLWHRVRKPESVFGPAGLGGGPWLGPGKTVKGWDESLQAPKGYPEDLARKCPPVACHATCPISVLDNLYFKGRYRMAHPLTQEFGGWGYPPPCRRDSFSRL